MAPRKKSPPPKQGNTVMSRAGALALDNPVAAGGTVVMGLTACLIVANALGLQPGRHPAPLFVTRERAEVPALPEPEGRLGATAHVQEISALVMDLQSALRRYGLYEGPLDGLNGPATERAIRAYERNAGLQETGEASEALLALVLMNGDKVQEAQSGPVPRSKPGSRMETLAPRPPVPPADIDNPAVHPDGRLMKIQTVLSDLGYGPLKADGVMGEATTAAIKRFELDRGLPLSGVPSASVVERLEMISGYKIDG